MKIYALILLTVFLVLSTFYRFKYINPRYDEGGAIQTILSAKYYNELEVYNQMWDERIDLTKCDNTFIKKYSFDVLPYVIVPIRWTYAVSVYPFITLLIDDNDSLEVIKIKGFFLFAVFNVVGFVFLGFLLIKHFNISFLGYVFIGLVISLGVDYLHYARSATTYAFLTLGVAIQLWAIKSICRVVNVNTKMHRKVFYFSVLTYCAAVILNHQFIVTGPFLALLILWLYYQKKIDKELFFKSLIIVLIVFVGDIYFLKLRSEVLGLHLNPGQNVLSNGINGEYSLSNYKGIFRKLIYFFYNIPIFIFYTLTGFYDPKLRHFALISGFLFLVFWISFLFYFRQKLILGVRTNRFFHLKISNSHLLIYYVFVNIFVFILLILLGRLNLSPTRHSLLFSILACIAIAKFSQYLPGRIKLIFFLICFCCLLTSTLMNIPLEYKKSFFVERDLIEYAKKNKINYLVLQRCWIQPLLSNKVNRKFDVIYRCGPRVWSVKKDLGDKFLYLAESSEAERYRQSYFESLFKSNFSFKCTDSIYSLNKEGSEYRVYLYEKVEP